MAKQQRPRSAGSPPHSGRPRSVPNKPPGVHRIGDQGRWPRCGRVRSGCRSRVGGRGTGRYREAAGRAASSGAGRDPGAAALAARVEALRVGLTRKDATSALLAATDRLDGLLGSVAALVRCNPVRDGDRCGLRRCSRRCGRDRSRCGNGCVRPSQGRGPGTGRPAARRCCRDRAD